MKTTMPEPTEGIVDAVACGVPVLVAGGAMAADRDAMLGAVREAIRAGAAGVAFGRNVWGDADPADVVAALREIVHGA